jgi:hypothetical protein
MENKNVISWSQWLLREGAWRVVFLLILVIGAGLGLRNYQLAQRALFVVPEEGLVLSLIALVSGPWLVLPATLVGFFSRRGGGYLLLAGGTVSLAALGVVTRELNALIGWLWNVSGPMLFLGAGLLWCAPKGPVLPKQASR